MLNNLFQYVINCCVSVLVEMTEFECLNKILHTVIISKLL